MNETKRIERESYEAPAVLDISPVTVNGSALDPTSNIQDPENLDDHT